jgi:hypothetical protein
MFKNSYWYSSGFAIPKPWRSPGKPISPSQRMYALLVAFVFFWNIVLLLVIVLLFVGGLVLGELGIWWVLSVLLLVSFCWCVRDAWKGVFQQRLSVTKHFTSWDRILIYISCGAVTLFFYAPLEYLFLGRWKNKWLEL